jgi:hypothetical protein
MEIAPGIVVERTIWIVPAPLRGSSHFYKYRLALVAHDVCVMRYDNEAGKGDHRHLGNREFPYDFVDPDQLLVDFWEEVERWMIGWKR